MIKNATYLITNKCNSHCINCNIWKESPSEQELSLEDVKTLFSLKELANLKELGISGGEPFLRKDIDDVFRAIFEVNKSIKTIYLTTNASIPNKVIESCMVLTKLVKNINIGVSIDGNRETNKIIRGTDNYDQAVMLLKEIKNQFPDIKTSISFTVCDENCNLENLNHINNLSYELGCDFSFRVVAKNDSYYKNPTHRFELSDKQRDILINFIMKNKLNDKFMAEQIYYLATGKVPVMHNYYENKNVCQAGNLFVFIHSDGKIYPCINSTSPIGSFEEGIVNKIVKPNACPCFTECTIWPTLIEMENLYDSRN